MKQSVKLITAEQIHLINLNSLLETTEGLLRLYVLALLQLGSQRQQNRELTEDYNRLLHVSQTHLYQDAYEHLLLLLEHDESSEDV